MQFDAAAILTATLSVGADEQGVSAVTLQPVPQWTLADRVTNDEILWTTKTADAGFSSDDIGSLFCRMSDDEQSNPVVSYFRVCSSKVSCTLSRGQAPYFHEDVVMCFEN